MTGVSRRRLLAWTGAAGALGASGVVVGDQLAGRSAPAAGAAAETAAATADSRRLAPYDATVTDGALPLGLDLPVPAFGCVLSLDLSPASRSSPASARAATASLLQRLSGPAAAELTTDADAAAALDVRAARLEITPGVGASLLEACGLSHRRPSGLVDLPSFATDRLEDRLSGGDLLVQIAAEDPMRLAGGVQAVTGLLGDGWRVRWSRPGFRRSLAAAVDPRTTTRNLMGHRDGTANPELGSPLWRSTVVVSEPGWMEGGSYLVARQIRIDLDRWFDEPEQARDATIGRHTDDGAALGRQREDQRVNLDARHPDGSLVVPAHAHIRLASTRDTMGARIYRRSWNFDDGFEGSRRRAGLMFLAWQADIEQGFIPIQASLTQGADALSAFVTHVGSAVFAVPARGTEEYVGQRLMED